MRVKAQKKVMKKIMIIAVMLMISIAAVQAQTPVNARQKAQRVRIAEGRANGDLTKGETALLNKQQRNIRRSECVAKADGVVTVRERRELHRQQHRANHAIRRAKHNPIDRKG
ncbi:hypothetical protein SanaruYs_30020 [Chryseotalea sanaruensis]|uniref:Uncharacterized protein n=2 Tax=Chryseotalea sanaruensis TaxID=2482724 RepID=A0A401UD12_9BACT|nr:hypothetical protein SanaruYs_30020 [Chryseotalea sanaruensis]